MIRAEIEAALRRDLGDEQAWSVFGDLLADAGDARGELIALEQRATASPPGFQRAELEHRAAGVVERERRGWLGPLADAALELEWRRGFIIKASVAHHHTRVVSQLLDLPAAALLRELAVVRPRSLTKVLAQIGATPITALELHAPALDDLAPLAELTQLEALVVEASATAGLAELRALPRLEHLELRRFRGGLDGFEAPFPALRELALTARADAGALGSGALDPLAHQTQLRALDLHDGGWSNLWPLAQARALEHLDLRSTDVNSVEALTALTRLRALALSGCADLSNLAPLAGMVELERLELRYTRVRDLRPLRELPWLSHLDLSGTPVTDLSPLFELPALAKLSVEACEVDDLGPLLDRGVTIVGVRPPPPTWREVAERLLPPE